MKRISRKDLKKKIKELQADLLCSEANRKHACCERDELKAKLNKSEKRLMELGKHTETYEIRGSGVERIEILPDAYGNYIAVTDLDVISDKEMDQIKERLVKSISRALLEENLVQIIVHERGEYGPLSMPTIGAKVYVIPWDKLAKKVVLHKNV